MLFGGDEIDLGKGNNTLTTHKGFHFSFQVVVVYILLVQSLSISLWLLWEVTGGAAQRGVTRCALMASFFSRLWRSRRSLRREK